MYLKTIIGNHPFKLKQYILQNGIFTKIAIVQHLIGKHVFTISTTRTLTHWAKTAYNLSHSILNKHWFSSLTSFYLFSNYSLQSANFPTHLLPVVVEPGTVAGKLQKSFFGIPVGTPVGVALGDFQCSVLSSTSQLTDAGIIQIFTFDRSTAVYITSLHSFFLFVSFCLLHSFMLYLI